MSDKPTERPQLDLDEILKCAEGSAYRCDLAGEYLPSARRILTEDVPKLVAELKQLRRGGKELGKVIDKNAEIMRDTVIDGATSPRLARLSLERLADWLAEADGLTAGEYEQVIAGLSAQVGEPR